MKVKVGDKIYDGSNEPIMVILTKQDKENIKNMPDNAFRYCAYNDEKFTEEEIKKWIMES